MRKKKKNKRKGGWGRKLRRKIEVTHSPLVFCKLESISIAQIAL